jgi:hypothetical protein
MIDSICIMQLVSPCESNFACIIILKKVIPLLIFKGKGLNLTIHTVKQVAWYKYYQSYFINSTWIYIYISKQCISLRNMIHIHKIRLWKGVIHPIFHLKMFVHVRNMTANCAYMYRVRRGLAILHIYIYIFVFSQVKLRSRVSVNIF